MVGLRRNPHRPSPGPNKLSPLAGGFSGQAAGQADKKTRLLFLEKMEDPAQLAAEVFNCGAIDTYSRAISPWTGRESSEFQSHCIALRFVADTSGQEWFHPTLDFYSCEGGSR